MRKAAVFRRTSDIKQGGEGQRNLEDWAHSRGLETWRVFTVHDSAWVKRGPKGEEFDKARAAVLDGARKGEFQVLIIWALDRLSRRGIKDTLSFLEQLHDLGIEVWSDQEPWLQVQGDMWEMQVAMFAWQAQQESRRKSERMKASIAGRKAEGKRVGRAPGSADRKPRKRSGYVASWEEGGANRARDPGWVENRARNDAGQFTSE